MGGSSCFIPHDSPIGGVHLVVSATGKALPQATGISGGYPAGTQYDVLKRNARVAELFAAGRIPATLEEAGGTADILEAHLETHLGEQDVYYTHWQGGGGYGDPLLRDPILVARDVEARKVSAQAANDIYGVLLNIDGSADDPATRRRRTQLRCERVGEPVPNQAAE